MGKMRWRRLVFRHVLAERNKSLAMGEALDKFIPTNAAIARVATPAGRGIATTWAPTTPPTAVLPGAGRPLDEPLHSVVAKLALPTRYGVPSCWLLDRGARLRLR